MSIFFADDFQENKSTMLKSTIKALELILVSAGLITTVLMLKGAIIPYSCELVFSSLMGFWSSIRCILSSPLYICIIINFMVLLIAVTSNFHNQETTITHDDIHTSPATFDGYVQTFKSQPPPPAPPPSLPRELPVSSLSPPRELPVTQPRELPVTPPRELHAYALPPLPPSREIRSIEKKSNLSSPLLSSNSDFIQEFKKPLNHSSSSRASFSTWDFNFTQEIKKPVDSVQADHLSTVSHTDDKQNEEDQDTMEATWKLITGGGDEKPKKKELRKSETFMMLPRTNNNVQLQKFLDTTDEQPQLVLPPAANWKELRKSETFNDTVSITRNGGMIRRDPSMSLDELNKQVEAFIKKFNADMRLQRQESDQRFLEMINQEL